MDALHSETIDGQEVFTFDNIHIGGAGPRDITVENESRKRDLEQELLEQNIREAVQHLASHGWATFRGIHE